MNSKPAECVGCPLYALGEGYVPPYGTCGNRTLIMGEAPAEEEVKVGQPFVGPSGRLLERILTTGKLAREDYGIINTIQCRPPDNRLSGEHYEASAIHHCKVHRDNAITRFRPERIIALGDIAFRTLTGESGISEKRGYHYHSGYQTAGGQSIPVIGTYHPAHLIYDRKAAKQQAKGKVGMSLMQAVLFDIKEAPTIPREDPHLIPAITGDKMEEFKKHAMLSQWLAVDIETPTGIHLSEEDRDIEDPSFTINYCSLAIPMSSGDDMHTQQRVWGISFPWQEPYIGMTAELLATTMPKLLWNYMYDVPRLEHNGLPVNGKIIDVQWLWHFMFSDLPKALGKVAPFYLGIPEWKSKKDGDLAYYSAMDSWATGRLYQEIWKQAGKRGLQDILERHVTQLLAVLRKMSTRGVCIDLEGLEQFKITLKDQLAIIEKELDQYWPQELRKYHPEFGYARTPTKKVLCKFCAGTRWIEHAGRCKNCKDGYARVDDVVGMIQREFTLKDGTKAVRWAKVLPYNPSSPFEIKDYASHMGHTLTATGKKLESSEEKYLSVMANRYPDSPIYSKTIEYRGLAKLLGTYTNWPMTPVNDKLAKVHTRFTLKPATGRLSSTAPNVQNIPHDEDDAMAMQFRKIICATPGRMLVRADYKGIEAVLTGYFAGDSDYMKLALKGVHAYNTAVFLAKYQGGKEVPPIDSPEFEPFLKVVKKGNPSLYAKLKKIGHGTNYGEGPFKIFDQNPGMFTKRAEAKQLHGFIKGNMPKVITWQNTIVRQTGITKKVTNPFGRPRWLFDIPGEDGPAAIAQLPQSTAADIIFDAMLGVDADRALSPWLVWQIHDELVLDVPKAIVTPSAYRLKEIMERPIRVLGGLVIGVDLKIGANLYESMSLEEWIKIENTH